MSDKSFKKGSLHLLKAWNYLCKKYPDLNAELTIIGHVPAHHQKLIKEFKELKKVYFIGYVKDIENYYHCNDVFISASIIDMGPRTIKQAMASSMLVVATKQCGGSSFINPRFTYNYNDHEALSVIISSLVSNREPIFWEGRQI